MRWLLGLVIGLPLALGLVLALLLGTAPGTRLVLGAVVPLVPGLSITGLEGSLSSPLRVSGLRYAAPTLELGLEQAILHWRPGALLRGRLRITELAVEGLNLKLGASAEPAEPSPEAEPLRLPELPVAVELDQLRLVDVRMLDEAGNPTLELSSAALTGHWSVQELALELLELSLDTPDLALAATGAVTLAPGSGLLADARLRSQLRYQLTPSDRSWTPVAGALRTHGAVRQLEIDNALEAPHASVVTGVLSGLPTVPAVDLNIRIDAVDPAQVRSGWPAGQVGGELRAEGGPGSWVVEVSGRGTTLERWSADLAGRFRGSLSRAEIEALEATTSFGQLTASGAVGWQEQLAADLKLRLTGFNPVEFAPQWPGAIDAEVDFSGRWPQPDDPATLNLRLAPLRLGGELRSAPLRGTLDLAVADSRLSIAEGAQLRWGENELQLDGIVDEAGRGGLRLAPAFNDLTLIPELGARGRVSGALELSGTLAQPRSSGALKLEEFSVEALSVAGAEIEWALDAEQAAAQQLRLRIDALAAGAQPPAQIQLDINGPLDEHEAALRVAQGDGSLAVRWQGDVAALPAEPDWLMHLDGWWADGGSYRWTVLEIDALPETGAGWMLGSGGSGVASALEQRLARSCFVPRPRAARTAAALERPAWWDDPGQLCIAASRDVAGALDLAYDLDALPLALAQPVLQPEQSLSGRLSGGGELRLPDPQQPAMTGRATLNLADLEFRLQGYDTDNPERRARVLTAAGGGLNLVSKGKTAQLELDLPLTLYDYAQVSEEDAAAQAELPALFEAQLNVDLDAASWDQVALRGSARASVDSLGFLSALSPEVTAAGGQLRGDLSVAGTPAEPLFGGSLRWLDGSLSLLTPGLALRDIELSLKPTAGGTGFELAAALRSGPGQLALDGTIDLGPRAASTSAGSPAAESPAGLTAALRVTGDRALLVNTAEARVLASPELTVRYQPQLLTLRGAVAVPEANIALQQFPPSAVVSSRDAVVIRESAEERATDDALAIDAQLKLELGERVSFSGFGLETRMTGALDVRQRPNRNPTGRGEIELKDGEFRAYGQSLAIERGLAIWTDSPIAEPGIDLRAYRLPRPDIKVGVHARGPLSVPRIELFSEPTLTESDQLSYLVLGRPLENNSSSEQSLLSQAALALGIRGGNFLTNQFGDRLGVDEIGIQTEAGAGADQAAFVVGKYLSPSLYVSYGVGLLDAVSRLKLEYFLSRSWTLQSESSTLASGGDLIYHIERN
ncbi:MAG: translocation/assembly module TamB domain-containing protein [Pseudomonadota bacterium]